MSKWINAPEAKRIRDSIDWSLANIADERQLRDRLEGMATGHYFKALSWYWAPLLYARNKALFRPFILHYLTDQFIDPDNNQHWESIAWKDDVARALDPWLDTLEADGETSLYRRLYGWKHRRKRGWGIDEDHWRADLQQKFANASVARRPKLLELMDLPVTLDEPTAVYLYTTDPTTRDFILRHLPRHWWTADTKRQLWPALAAQAQAAGDEEFYFRLYRRQVALDQWCKDALALCKAIQDPQTLDSELERRHPESPWHNLGKYYLQLLNSRGEDVIPYLRRHLRNVHGFGRKTGFDDLAQLALRKGWLDFWAMLVLQCGNKQQYNAAVKSVLDASDLDDTERLRRLNLFSGASREWNGIGWGLARVQPLEEPLALSLYQRYPDLVRGSFKANITPGWGERYFELFELAWQQGDEALADYLASRYVTISYLQKKQKQNISDIVTERYLALKLDDIAFARRASQVLTLIPAYAIYDYNRLIRENRLARLLFERSLKDFLDAPDAVQDLVEASEIHVQHLAYRVLAQADARARALAQQQLPILLGTLLRPLHRRTRLAAFAALDNAASSPDTAKRVVDKIREAFALPDERYPKEALVGLLGRILARFPALATAGETRIVYRHSG